MLCPIVGANWNNSSNAGVWTLNLNNTRSNSNTRIGARADLDPVHLTVALNGVDQRETVSGFQRNRCAASFLVAPANVKALIL
jgi:hypothetical protein